ncbi:MAG: PEGA domain-containing protein [Myxococcota bacterium]
MIVWCAVAQAAPISVDYAEEADLQFHLGIEAYDDRDYTGALEHLLASNRLVPNKNVVFNLARTYEQIGTIDAAWRYYERYVEIEDDPAARSEAEQALHRLTPRVARIEVTSEPPGATVYVERTDLGARGVTPLTLALPAGGHEILLERDGFVPKSLRVELSIGTLAEIDLALIPRGGPTVVEVDPVGGWVSTVVRTPDLVLVEVTPDRCLVLGGDHATYVEPLIPLPRAAGSALAEPSALWVDVVVEAGASATRSTRAALRPAGWRSNVLEDASLLHQAVFDRCVPTNGEGLSHALSGLPKGDRAAALRLFAEWAAWRGAPDAEVVAAMCRSGSCASLADRLTH